MSTIIKADTLKAGLAELTGAFFLTLAALLSGTPYAVALTLAAFVYAIGNISGCHINPAVTVGLVAARRLPILTGLLYVYAQVMGALLARVVAPYAGALPAQYHAASPVGEMLGAGFLILTVVAVSDKYVPKAGSGIAIGAALAAGLVTSGGILNPAVAVAMGLAFSPATWATLLSGVGFALLWRCIAPKDAPKPEAAPAQG